MITARDMFGNPVTLAPKDDTAVLRRSGQSWFDAEVEAEPVDPCAGLGRKQRAHWRHRRGSYYRYLRLVAMLQANLDAR